MGFAMLSFFAVFLLIASGGLLLFYREAMMQRISDVINPNPKPKSLLGSIQSTGLSIGGVVQHFENVLPKSQAEISVVKQRLIRAGYRKESELKAFYGSKVLVPLLLCVMSLVSGLGSLSPLFVYGACLVVGFLGPDFWGKADQEAPGKNPPRPSRCPRSSRHLHRGRTQPGPGNGPHRRGIGQCTAPAMR